LYSRGEDSERRLAFVCSRYPAVSHAFVVREARALRARGVEVHTFSVRRPADSELLSSIDRDEHRRTFSILPPRPLRLVAAHLRAAFSAPLRYLSTLFLSLRLSTGGPRSTLWRAFYFVEAIVLWHECRRRGVCRLHVHFPNVGSDLTMLAAHFGGPDWSWSFTMHSCNQLLDESPLRLAEKIGSAAFVVCTSDFVRAQMMQLVPLEEWRKLSVVRVGLNTDALHPPSARAGGGPLRLLTVAQLVRRKGHAVLLDALARLRSQGVDVTATFVGDGPERESLERLAADLGLDVRFAGAVGQGELGAYYADAQVFCLPTFAEGLPVVLMEAMGSALPVVSTSVMGVPELVEDGESGLLVSPGREDQLADAIARLASAPDLRERMGSAGRRVIVEELGLGPATDALIELIWGDPGDRPSDAAGDARHLPEPVLANAQVAG
jgi:colanic acid/amylovoran biosynthesis glycosyltransferase